MNFDLSFYFAIFLRRLHYFVFVTALVSAAAIATALLLPSVYQAQSILLVESSQIPGQLAAPTVQTASLERLQTAQNRLMTRANLLDIATRLNVFKDIKSMSPDDVVKAMRDATKITNSAAKGEATLMTLTFNADVGKTAAGVVNEYVTLILKADVDTQTKDAQDTLEFFDQEVKTLNAQLDQMSAKLLDFQNKNADALPSTLSFRLTQQTSLQGKFDIAEQNIKQLNDQKDSLIAVYKSTGQVANNTANMTPEAKQLAALNDQLTQSLALLAPSHPKIKVLKAQIAQLEIIVKSQSALAGGSTDPATSMFDAQIADLDSRIKTATQQRDLLLTQLKALQDTIDRTPANQVALDALNRDYTNLQQQYNGAVSRQSQAAAGEKIATLSKGEKISVLDSAAIPDSPIKPKRVLICIGGVVAGMLLGLGLIVIREILNRSVRRPKDIVQSFGITPIVTIPYYRTPTETMQRRSVFLGLLLLAVIGIPSLLYAVHVFYEPLDLIISRAAAKIGIRI